MSEKSKGDLVAYRLKRARQTINEIEEHLEKGFYHTAVNRIYYASFYAVNGLFLYNNINVKTHSGVRRLFGQHFVHTEKISREFGNFFSEIFDYRHTSDYDDFIEIDETLIRELHQKGKEFIDKIEELLKSPQ